jgi:hypothetical protein
MVFFVFWYNVQFRLIPYVATRLEKRFSKQAILRNDLFSRNNGISFRFSFATFVRNEITSETLTKMFCFGRATFHRIHSIQIYVKNNIIFKSEKNKRKKFESKSIGKIFEIMCLFRSWSCWIQTYQLLPLFLNLSIFSWTRYQKGGRIYCKGGGYFLQVNSSFE